MLFKSKRKKLTHDEKVIISDRLIKEVNNTKIEELYIDENLSWKYHMSHVTMKMSKVTGILVEGRRYLPLKTLQMLYMTMISPYLTYRTINWASSYPTRLNPILKAQKRLIRIMTFSKSTQKNHDHC